MTARKPKPRTTADRQRDYRARQAVILRAPLDQQHASMLADILADSGETAAAWARRMIREQARREHAGDD